MEAGSEAPGGAARSHRHRRVERVIITVDTASGVPPYEQIRDQVSRMIASGVLPPGTRLPTIQQLANDLQLAPGTGRAELQGARP